jgi:HPt (histidine-containing phosphotransfer) domain-containing protein
MADGKHDIVVDLGHLAQYTFGDGALEAELFDLFLTNGKRYIAGLTDAPSIEDWRAAAHALKGSARGIGAITVARLSETAEGLESVPAAPEKARIVAALEAALAEVGAFVASRGQAS